MGACLGGNMTIIGAAANVIVSENSAAKGHPISFIGFLKYGFVVMVISLLISSLRKNLVWIKLRLFWKKRKKFSKDIRQ